MIFLISYVGDIWKWLEGIPTENLIEGNEMYSFQKVRNYVGRC